MPDNISKLYQELKDTYELGSENDFRKYLSDGKKREALRKELEAEYEVGDSASFTKYLGLDAKPQPQPQQSAQQPRQASQPKPAQQPAQPKAQPQPLNIPEGFGELDIQQANRMGMGRGPVSWEQPGVINPTTGKPEKKQKKNAVKDIDRAIKGDKEAAKRTGVSTSAKRMQEEAEYMEATGKPLQNIVNTPVTAPTAVKDESGQMLLGTTTDEQRVSQYQQQERETARKQIINSAVDRLQQQMEADALAEYKSRLDEISESGLAPELTAGDSFKAFNDRMKNTSPEALLERLNKAYGYDEKGNHTSDFANRFLEENRDAIEQAAGRLGMRVEDYVYDDLLPILSNGIAERFQQNMSEKYSVKDTADYLTRMMGNSMIGTLATMGAWTKKTRQFVQEETQKSREGKGAHYNSNMGTNLLGETLMFAADAAPLMIGGAIGNYTAKGVGAALSAMGKRELGALVATSSPFLAANVGKAVKYGGMVGGAMARGIGSMAPFMAASGAVQEMSVGDGTLASIGRAALEGAWEGTKFGAVTGAFGVGSHALGSKLSGAGKKAAFLGGSFLVENQIFAGLDYIKDPENFNWAESTEDAFYMQLASKFSSAHGIQGVVNQFKSLFAPKRNAPVQLSDTDKEAIQRAFGGMDFTEIASDVNNIGKILGDKQNIPWVTRMKVAAQTMNTSEPSRPRTMQVNMRANEIREIGENGELIEVHPFNDKDEAIAIRQQIEDRRANDDMLADYGKLSAMHDVQPSQAEIDTVAQEMLDNTEGLRPEDVQPGGKSYDMVLDEARSRSNIARQIITQFAQDYNMTEQEVLEIMNKKPIERVDDEPDLMADLARRFHDFAYPKGEKHTDQSRIDGQTLAGDEATVNPETSVQIAQEFDEARNAYLNYPVREDVQEGINSLGENARLDDIYMFVRQNYSGSDVDGFLQVLADYANAMAKRDGYISQTGANIEETVGQEIDHLGFHGTIDEASDPDNIIRFTHNGVTYTLLNGNVGTWINAHTDPTTGMQVGGSRTIDPDKSGDMIIALGENGQWVSFKPDALMEITDVIPKEEYANQRREELGEVATATLVETGVVKPEEEEKPIIQSPGPKTASKDLPEGVGDGPKLTAEEQASAEASAATGTGADEVPASPAEPITAMSKIPTLKDGEGKDILDEEGDPTYQWEQAPLADTLAALGEINHGNADRVTDAVDAMLGAAVKEVEATEKLTPKSSNPIKRAREQDAIDAQKAEAQSKVEYWTAAKEELAKAKEAESELNNPPAAPNVPDNSVPLQPTTTGEKPKGKTADEKRAERIVKLKQQYGDDFDDDFSKAQTPEELASMYIGRNRTLSRESLAQELGYGLGLGTDNVWAETLLAKKGEGLSTWDVAHAAYESDENPTIDSEGTKMFSDKEIHDALITVFQNARSKADIMDYAINEREARAKKLQEDRLRNAAEELGKRVEDLTEEEVMKATSTLPFGESTEDDLPKLPKTRQEQLVEEVSKILDPNYPIKATVIDAEHTSEKDWSEIASKAYGGAFVGEEEIAEVKRYMQDKDGGFFIDEETGTLYISDHVSIEKVKDIYEQIKEAYDRAKEEATIADTEPGRETRADGPRIDETESGEGKGRGDEGQGKGHPESDGKPDTSERDEYLKPRNEKEEEIVADVEDKLNAEIEAAKKDVQKAKSDLEKAKAKESDRATDVFSDDPAFEKPDQLFSFDEMGGTDRTQEGVNRRTEGERRALEEAQKKLDKLQSDAERNSRIRGALDNERRQTSFDEGAESQPWENMGMLYEPSKDGKKALVGKEFVNRSGRHTVKVTGYDEATDTVTWTDNGTEHKGNPDFLRKDSWSEKPSTSDPMEAIEQTAKEFKDEQDKQLGITHEETPEQQAQAAGQQLLTEEPQLTEADIDGTSLSKVMKTYAKAYLKGKTDNELYLEAYLEAKEDVRNRRQDNEANRSDAGSGTQLAGSDDKGKRRPERTGSQTGGVDAGKDVSIQGSERPESGGVQRVEDSKDDVAGSDGERGDNSVSGQESSVGGLHSGSQQSTGSRVAGSGGHHAEQRPGNSRQGDGVAEQPGPRDANARRKELKSKRDELLAKLAEARKKKRLGGDDTLKVQLPVPSIVPTSKEEREIFWELVSNTADYGYTYLEEGLTKFNDWKARVLEDYVEPVKDFFGWGKSEVDRYIEQVWNSDYEIDGVTRTMSEWASFLGEEQLKKVVKEDLSTKYEKQMAAEGIKVKTGDIANIRETLPYLLPEQQDDVLKAETQFFDETHQDRQHGNGKGMMFTNGTGTGKTFTGLGIVKRFVKQGKGRVLILTPSQEKVTDWANDGLKLGLQIEKLDDVAKATGTTATKSKGKGVVVTTYANARQNLAMLEDCFDLIVYDESHKIMESKEAANTTMMDFHEMLTNKNVERSIDRQTYWLPEWIEHRNLLKEREVNREQLDTLSKIRYLTPEQEKLQTRLNTRMVEIDRRFEELRPIMQEIRESKREQAEIDSKRTKTVFLSATPFNVRESLRYAEGYLFSYPEEDKNTIGTYNHRSPEEAFLEQTFPGGYRWRYGRLESHVENADALGRQEIDFSDYLQNQLGTISGRMIASDYDYSRDFPVLTLDNAGRFNQAMSEVYRNRKYQPLADIVHQIWNYNDATALFEAMKTSLVNDRIKEHLNRGQKVVVFHRRRTSGDIAYPFARAMEMARAKASDEQDGKTKQRLLQAVKDFEEDFKDIFEWEKTIDYTLPRNQIEKRFGKNNVAFFSGEESKTVKHKSVEDFMKDNGGKDIIVIQEASGKEGISLHDQTGEHQRVEINLALPQSPIAFIQIEGRIYRIGQKSNAIFEYPLLGLDLETSLFAQKFNNALSTTENLALGSKARNLRKSIANSVLENMGVVDYDRQGFGGKDMDGRVSDAAGRDGFDQSIQDYYGNQKLQRGRDNREGVDYFPTPEPIGYKMVEWAQMIEGETALEPSAGHGAIARYVPETNGMTAIEPSASLFNKLQMRAGGPGRRFEETTFENYALGNKHDVILMNPPYGTGGKTAMEHVAKAFKHLNEGGRIVAIIPDGPAMEKRFDAWLHSTGSEGLNGAAVLTGEVKLPDVAFGRAGTNVRTRVVVIDKVTRPQMREKVPSKMWVDLSGETTIDGLFEKIRNVRMPERTIDTVAINEKKAKRTQKAIEENPFTRRFEIGDDNRLYIESRSRYVVSDVNLNLEKPMMENVLIWYKNLKNTMEHPESIENGKYVGKSYGRGKDKVSALDAIRDYCKDVIKTLENVTGVTADQMDKMIREQDEARQRMEEERKAEIERIISERDQRKQDAIATFNQEFKESNALDKEYIESLIIKAHSNAYMRTDAQNLLRRYGIDWETGKKIDKNEPVNARTSTVVQPEAPKPQPAPTSDFAYNQDKNTRTGEDMHLVKMNKRVSNEEYKEIERKAKAQGGYYNRFKKAFHFNTEKDARMFMESVNASDGNDGSPQTRFRLREKEAPKKTQKVYKLMRLGEDGKLYPLFIDAAAPTELGKWYDADSPDMSILKSMPSGTFLVDYAKGTYVSLDDYAKERGIKVGKNPSAELVNEATKNGQRWVRISDAGRAQRRYEGESRKYMNIGINGSGQVSEFAMRPGWHAGSLPSMRQIGKGKDRNLRDDRFVWVEGEVPADRDWQAEADRNPDKDIPTHIPEDGFYLKATNANKAASQADRIGWYVAGAFKANRIMSDREARNVITEWNREHPDQPVEYDFERESGREFNAETMQLEDKSATRFRKGGEENPVEAAYERNRKAGEKLAKSLNMDFEAVTDQSQIKNKEVLDAIAAGEEPTGWIEIDEKTGKKKIYMYLPNVRDTYEAEKTIAHETVGHYGLRELLGEKGYKSYMRSLVFDLKTPELSKYIQEHLSENGFDMYRTVDEYLADAAEKGYGDLTMWQKVKDAFTDAMRNAGFTMAPSISDVKYMLWLSKHNLEKGNVANDAKRQALLMMLGKERYEAKVRNGEFTYGDTENETSAPFFPGNRTLFRHTPSAKYQKHTYERALKRLGFVWKEAHIDAMQSAVELVRAISGVKKIEEIPSAENFVLLENQMSSKEEQMDFLFNRDYMEPLDKAVSAILPDMGKGVDEQLRNLQLYMIMKHGLERNRYIPIRDAIRDMRNDPSQDQKQVDQLEQDYERMIEDNRQDLRDGTITLREYFDEIDAWIKHNIDPQYKAGEKDYSGLSDMMGTKGSYDDSSVIDDVMSTEARIGKKRIDNLWEKTKAVSQFGLDTEYEGGLDSKEKHDKVSRMFEWYVPLRGYDEKTAEEVYDYLEERGNDRKWAGPVLMNAKGRESMSDIDVFATLGSMSSSAINRALRNQMKQAFARFVRNHYNSGGVEAGDRLVTELPYLWAEKQFDPTTGQEVWVEKFPDIPEKAKADDIAQILDQYQQDMKAKEGTGDAKRIRQNSTIPYRPASSEHRAQHIVDVWINGEKHAFIVNGNPRAAQAINGQLKAERNSNILWLSSLSHFMAKMNTSLSPDFIMRNTERDLIYSAANIAVKENAEYWFKWAKNYGVATGRAAFGVPAAHTNLFKRYRDGKLNMNNETDRYFKEFMENGGETGWVERKNLDKWKKLIKEGVRKESAPEKVGKAIIDALPDAIEAMNERAENLARFATYMTSRQSGRTIVRSVSDAKEVSVNFNRKGAGRKTVGFNKQDGSWLSNANAYMAGWSAQNLQDYIMFYNAGVQGMTNMVKNVANHPIKGTTTFAVFALAGMLMPRLNQFLFDEDDDKTGKEPENPYAELPEWVRRNNLCIYSDKGSFITIALPIELRAMYGIGDMAASYISNPELRSTKNAGVDILTQLNQVAPLDFMGEGAGPLWSVVPSGIRPFAEAAANVNWLGQPIEREEEKWNENKPRWTRAFKNVGDVYVGASKKLNAATNPYGNENIKGWADGALTDPALVEHVVNGYFGGLGSTVNRVAQLFKHADEMSKGELITSNWMPIVRTQHYTPNERTRYARTRNKWWYYKEEADKTKETIKTLKKQGEHDPLSFMKSVSEEEGKKGTRAKIMEKAYKRYDKIKKKLEKTDDLQQKNIYQLQLDQIMEGTVKELDKIQ